MTGGNQGSHFLNIQIFNLIKKLESFLIFHQVGTANFGQDHTHAKSIRNHNYFSTDYLGSDNIGAVLNRADLVIARSGANTIWDLALLAKVAILVPLPFAASGEQLKNAKILERAGSATILEQKNFKSSTLMEYINKIFQNYPKFQKEAQIFSKSLPKNAIASIIKVI